MVFTEFKGKDGDRVKNDFIKPKVIAWTQEVTARYPVTDIFGDKRTEINNELDVYLNRSSTSTASLRKREYTHWS